MSKEKNIPVLDLSDHFLSYTSPAKARLLIKSGRAFAFSKDPFMIKMRGEVEENAMKRTVSNQRRAVVTNFTKYFQKEREVYVQNMGSTQISLAFKLDGQDTYILIPRTRKPYNLTQHVPFMAIKNSTDFRAIINRRNPPILKLIEEEEFLEYYDRLAARNSTTFEEELSKAEEAQYGLMDKRVVGTERIAREMEQQLEKKMDELEKPDSTHPQIVGFCAKADKEYMPRLKAEDFIEELEALEHELSPEDWEFVSTKGVYKTVKNFAAKKLDVLTSSEEDDDPNADL